MIDTFVHPDVAQLVRCIPMSEVLKRWHLEHVLGPLVIASRFYFDCPNCWRDVSGDLRIRFDCWHCDNTGKIRLARLQVELPLVAQRVELNALGGVLPPKLWTVEEHPLELPELELVQVGRGGLILGGAEGR